MFCLKEADFPFHLFPELSQSVEERLIEDLRRQLEDKEKRIELQKTEIDTLNKKLEESNKNLSHTRRLVARQGEEMERLKEINKHCTCSSQQGSSESSPDSKTLEGEREQSSD